MTQKQRILKALQAAGAEGIKPEDFLLPDVVDAGKPILRGAARIDDLRKEGLTITTDSSGHTAIYRLVNRVEAVPSSERGGSPRVVETSFTSTDPVLETSDSNDHDGAASSWLTGPDVVKEDLVWV